MRMTDVGVCSTQRTEAEPMCIVAQASTVPYLAP